MANKIEPSLGQDGEPIKWNPTQIPSTKPFMKIVTSAYEPITTFNNMQFVKTRSLIYTPFHKEAQNINFEVGYSKDAKWFEHLKDKWASYANFFVAGFFEAIYTAVENGQTVTYIQIDAKIIDYDARFKHPNSSSDNHFTSSQTSPSANIFAQRRNKFSSENSPSTPKPRSEFFSKNPPKPSIVRSDSITMEDAQETSDEDSRLSPKDTSNESSILKNNSITMEDVQEVVNEENTETTSMHKPKKQKSSNIDDEPAEESKEYKGRGGRGRGRGRGGYKGIGKHVQESDDDNDQNEETTPTHKPKKKQLSDLCNTDDESEEPKGRGGRVKRVKK